MVNTNLSEKAQHDYNLVKNAIKGDQKSYAELMGRYRDSIYFMLLKMVNNKSDAEDLTIEAFGKAFKNIDQYTPNYAFSTWLFKIATNNTIDFIRRKKENNISIDQTTQKEGEEINTTIHIKADGPDPEETMINQQKIRQIRSVINKLKPNYQELIELRYFKEYSYEEIADELSLPLGTIKAQLFRARELLFQILKKTDNNF